MNKPSITSDLLVQLTAAAPSRVQKRLDKNPGVANDWDWQLQSDTIQVNTGSQCVSIQANEGVVESLNQVQCDCLLAPKCLHILACVTQLKIVETENEAIDQPSPDIFPQPASSTDLAHNEAASKTEQKELESEAGTSESAGALFDAASRVVVTGYNRVGNVAIASLLQAAHHARAIGLHWPAAAAIRVVEGIRLLRVSASGADSIALRRDLYELLSSSRMIQQQTSGWTDLPGTARRKYHPRNEAMRLQGVFAEPILTSNGYSGMVVYLKDDKHQWFTISDVRLGDPDQPAERLANVWSGGIPIGNKTVSANNLIGSKVLIRGGGVSDDGRLGLGQKSEFVWSPGEFWQTESMNQWFDIDLTSQFKRIWKHRYTPELARPAGWDLIGLQVQVLGASGRNLIVETIRDRCRVPLGINSEEPRLEYRRNLQRLAATPGMLLNVIARFDFSRPDSLLPLAVTALELDETKFDSLSLESDDDDSLPRPRLLLPDSANGCWQLGWQRLQPEHFSRTTEMQLLDQAESDQTEWTARHRLLDPMQRRIQAMLQGGHYAIPDMASDTLQIEAARFLETWYETAAALLLELSTASATLRTAETQGETCRSIERLADLWVAGETWCESMRLQQAIRSWMPIEAIK